MGDPDAPYEPTGREIRQQRQSEEIAEYARNIAKEAPPLSAQTAARLAVLLKPDVNAPLMVWRLRLFCGHLVERTAHASHLTVHAAFTGSIHTCPECGLSPASIVAGLPEGQTTWSEVYGASSAGFWGAHP